MSLDPPAPPAPPTDIVGTVLNNKYKVLQRLSAGGMGVVYKARHLTLDTPVAIKVLLKPEDEEAQNRFLSEARLASKVRHPNTVYIADFGVLEDGRAFLEMEFLDGRTLGAELQSGALDPLRACQIAMQIARGLQAVHHKGIVHRDMKPDNVFLLQQDGTHDFVKLVDFGIAKAAIRGEGAPDFRKSVENGISPLMAAAARSTSGGEQPRGQTLPGNVMGTPGFMAPEQMQGLPLDVRVDQYPLGCMLYEMISGKPVFDCEAPLALMMKHMTTAPTPLRKLCPQAGVSESLDQLVLRLLAKEPKGRFASMREVEQALQREIDLLLIARGQKPATTAKTQRLSKQQLRLLVPALVVAGIALSYGAYRLLHRTDGDGAAMQSRELLELRQRAIALLRSDVKSAKPELRRSALGALGLSRDAELRAELEAALASPEPETRAAAAAALGALGDRKAIATLATLLDASSQAGKSELPAVKTAAAGALRQLGDPRGLRFLEQMLDTKDPEIQFRAALSFCEQGPKDAQVVLRAYLKRPGLPESTELSILTCLARAGDSASLGRLHALVAEVGPPELRLLAAVKLAQLGEPEGPKYLHEQARKRGPDQLLAARELALLDEPDGLEMFRQLLENRGAQSLPQQLAADGLGAIGEPLDARRLAALLAPPKEPPLIQAAARAIVQIAGRDPGLLSAQSTDWARSALGDGDVLARQSAAAILGDSMSAGAVSLLTGMLGDGDARVRRSAAAALGKRQDEAAVTALRTALADTDKGVRLASLRALLRNGELLSSPALSRAIAQLKETLSALLGQAQSSQQERILASSILLRLGDKGQLQRLRDWLKAPEEEVRLAALEQLTLTADELAALLSDGAASVSSLAARKLAALGDKRALPALRAQVESGGPDAVIANGLVARLGEAPAEPDPVESLLSDADPAKRSEAVEAIGALAPSRAKLFLGRAARDREPQIRLKVAEVAAELAEQPGGGSALTLLQRLSTDADTSVRTRAEALLSRRARSKSAAPAQPSKPEAGEQTAPHAANSKPAAAAPDGGAAAAEPGATPAATGLLLIEAPAGVQFQIDQRPWQAASERPIPIEAGRHIVNFLSGQRVINVVAGQTARVTIPTSQIEQLAKAGIDSFAHSDFKKAQRQMEKAIGLCSRDPQHAALCTNLSFELLSRLGQIHEQQREWPEAMTEYQRLLALAPQVRGKADVKAATQAAVQRLAPKLGQVVVPKRTKRGCQEETIWMRPGQTSIKVDSKFEPIEVKAREVVRVGTCK